MLRDRLPALERDFNLVLAREDVDDVIHNPEWVEKRDPPAANRAEKRVHGLPIRVVWRDTEEYHLIITVFVPREPFI